MKEEIQMRNLKRALSMALAAVMLLGMMVIGASASYSDFTDQDEIVHKEAVALLTDLGVISGSTPTTYNPTGTIERAALAKMIYFVMMGGTDATPYEGMDIFSDVSSSWAEGYINYCASVGIFGGVGKDANGKDLFSPYGTLTVAQAAKGLLVALGYVAEDRGYNGATWTIGVIRDAQSNGLLNGIDQGVNEAITRDNAAQMIFNALSATMVEPQKQYDMGNEYITGYKAIGSLGAIKFNGLTRVTGVVTANSKANLTGTKTASGHSTVVVEGRNKDVAIDSSVFTLGHEVAYYTNNAGLVSSVLVETGKTATTSTTFSTDKAYAAFTEGMKIAANAYSTNYGVANSTAFNSSNTTAGDTITFIDSTADGTYDYVVKVAYKFGQVLATVENADPTKASVSITNVGNKKLSEIDCDETLAKGDYVLYVTIGGTTYVEKAPSFTGTVTAVSTDKLYVSGVAYSVNANVNGVPTGNNIYTGSAYKASFSDASSIKKATEATFYTDKSGEIVLVVGQAAAATTAQYGVLLGVQEYPGEWMGDGKSYEVRMLLADGTSKIYTLSSSSTIAGSTLDQTDYTTVYAYSFDNQGNIKLDRTVPVNQWAVGVTKGSASWTNGGTVAKNSYLDADTVVLFYYKNPTTGVETISSYTGVANIPTNTGVAKSNVIVTKNGTVDFIFFNGQVADTSVASAAVYAYCDDATLTTTADGKSVVMIINGQATTLTIDGKVTPAAGKVYTVVTKDGISSLTEVTAEQTAVKVIDVTDSYVVIQGADSKFYTYSFANGYTVDDISNLDDEGNVIPATGVIAKNATVTLYTNGAGKVVKAYIGQTPSVASVVVSVVKTGSKSIDCTIEAVGVIGGTATYDVKASGGSAVTPNDGVYNLKFSQTYTVTVTVKGNSGATATLTAEVAVSDAGVPTVTLK